MTVAERIRTEELNGLRLPPTPADRLDESQPNQAPVQNDRSFLDTAPVDGLTGVPLRVAPTEDIADLPDSMKNPHHGVFPNTRPELKTLSGRSVWLSSMQILPTTQHNEGPKALHNTWSGNQGPVVSADELERLGQCVALRASYIPAEGIDTSDYVAVARTLTVEENTLLRTPNELPTPTNDRIETYAAKWGITFGLARSCIAEEDEFHSASYRDFRYGISQLREFFSQSIRNVITRELAPEMYNAFIDKANIDAGLNLMSRGAEELADRAVLGGQNLRMTYDRLYDEGKLHPQAPKSAAALMEATLGCEMRKIYWLPAWRKALRDRDAIDDMQRVA